MVRFHLLPEALPIRHRDGSLTLVVTHEFPRRGKKRANGRLPLHQAMVSILQVAAWATLCARRRGLLATQSGKRPVRQIPERHLKTQPRHSP
jgi:hypothetical protein